MERSFDIEQFKTTATKKTKDDVSNSQLIKEDKYYSMKIITNEKGLCWFVINYGCGEIEGCDGIKIEFNKDSNTPNIIKLNSTGRFIKSILANVIDNITFEDIQFKEL